MLNREVYDKEWYNKEDILSIYPIKETTYKLRIKNIPTDKTRFVKSIKGKETREIHYSVLDELFNKRRKLSSIEKTKLGHTIKWVNNHKWNFFCNIKPEKATIEENVAKMNLLFEKLSIIKKDITFFYSIEKNKKNNYYHSHFLIDCREDMVSEEEIAIILEYLVEPNTKREEKNYVVPYDITYGKKGAEYSTKTKIYAFDVLYSKNIKSTNTTSYKCQI
jgi:hypothetical protein